MSRREAAALGLLVVAACRVGPNFHRPAQPLMTRYTNGPAPRRTVAPGGPGGTAQVFTSGAEVGRKWWTRFESPAVDNLVVRAVKNSPTLAAARARLRQAEHALAAGRGALFPHIDVDASFRRQRFSFSQFGQGGTSVFNIYSASAMATYDVDVFGKIRRSVEADRARVDVQRYQVEAAYLTLTGGVVSTVLTTASLRSQIDATHDIIDAEAKQLDLVERQRKIGAVSLRDVLLARSQLATTRATLPVLERQLDQADHALARLIGATPADFSPPPLHLVDIALPAEVPVTLPSTLVRRRPDILAAEGALHAASAAVGVATANLYPDLSLSASGGAIAAKLGDLFNAASFIWDLAADLAAPIFHGGTLRAEKHAAEDAYQAALDDYRDTVLGAFVQVADLLRALQRDAETVSARRAAADASAQAVDLVRKSYKLGAENYITVLIAQRQYQLARLSYVEALGTRYQDTAALLVALGGGWWQRTGGQPGKEP